MAYTNTNSNQALRDLRGMLVEMPQNRANREYQSALGRGAELQAMAGMKEHEMRLPAMQLQAEQAQSELDKMNAQFRIHNLGRGAGDPDSGPYDARLLPDQAIMMVQDQKYGPSGMSQFEQNIRQMGYELTPEGGFLRDGKPVAYRDAAPIHREWLRTIFLNTDMEKHRDNQIAYLESKGDLSPQDMQRIEKLKSLSPLQLAEMRLQKLQEIQMEDPMWDRPEGRLLPQMIEQAAARVNSLREAANKQAEMDWDRERFFEEERGKDRRANKGEGSDFYDKEEFKSLLGQWEDIQEQLTLGGTTDVSGNVIPFTPEQKVQLARVRAGLERRMSEIRGGSFVQPQDTQPAPKTEVPKSQLGQELDGLLERAGIENKAPEAKPGEAQAATLDTAPTPQPQPKEKPKEQPKQAQYSDVMVDKDGTIWGKDASGQPRRIMVKPPEKIYNGRYDNPEYQKYVETMKQYGLE